jgi:hypothetical protein
MDTLEVAHDYDRQPEAAGGVASETAIRIRPVPVPRGQHKLSTRPETMGTNQE